MEKAKTLSNSPRRLIFSVGAVAFVLAIASVAWACTYPMGVTNYDSSSPQSGGTGTQFTINASGAVPNATFRVQSELISTIPHATGHYCMGEGPLPTPTDTVPSDGMGTIANTTRQVPLAMGNWPGIYKLCFVQASAGKVAGRSVGGYSFTSTVPVYFNVT